MSECDAARRVLLDARAVRMFPAAALEVGTHERPLWRDALGTLMFDDGASHTGIDTPFDLASLTKVIVTTTIVMQLVARGGLRLDDPVADCFGEWRGPDRIHVTVRDLLEHASGLPARLVDLPGATRREFEHDICTMRLEYAPRSRSIYSDLGFILLGFLAADRGGASIAEQFDRFIRDRGEVTGAPNVLMFNPPPVVARAAAPTVPMDEDIRRGRLLAGEVHDDYASLLGGAAGHAGLFGTAPTVGAFARGVLRGARGDAAAPRPFAPDMVAAFTKKSSVAGSSRALGWDTMLPTSSCGTRMSPAAFGHVGFTGTSLWIDPARDRYFVLLTNRAAGGGTLEQMLTVRRAFHDALGDV